MMKNDAIYQKTVLPNGIRVVTERIDHVPSAAIGLWVAVGSSHESAPQRGISHCIEHMLFKGTASRSARQIAELMDSVGGHLNAFTDKESTCYHARVVDTRVPLAQEILSDMFVHSVFDSEELRKEKQVILEEIRMYDDSPDEVSQDLFLKSVWDGSTLGEPTIGFADTVNAISRQSILDYMRASYAPSSVIVTAAGNVDHAAFAAEVERGLGALTACAGVTDPPPPHFLPVRVVQRKDCEQVYVLVGAEGTSAADETRFVYSVLDTILGGGMASRLFQEIREKRGLVYSVYSSHQTYRAGGLMTIAAATRPANAATVLDLIRVELAKLMESGVTDEETARAKEHLKGGLLLSLESTSARMLRLGRTEMVLGRAVPPSEVIEKVDAVTSAQVNAIARSIFRPERLAVTVLGPVDERFNEDARLAQSA
jgi:predicted Zn-dependent peptidase